MRTVELLVAVVSGLLLLSTLICGLWMRYSMPQPPDASAVSFHVRLGIATVVFGFATVVLVFVRR